MDLDSRTYSKLHLVSYGDENFEKYGRIVDAIWPLTKRRDHETPEMWCSRICDLFRKILEENPRILSKNGYCYDRPKQTMNSDHVTWVTIDVANIEYIEQI